MRNRPLTVQDMEEFLKTGQTSLPAFLAWLKKLDVGPK